MKTKKTLFLVPALIAVLNLLPAGRIRAQAFLHSFTAVNTNSSGVYTNSDGTELYAGLIANPSGSTLYGTASAGGCSGNGTVFALNTDGSGFTNLHNFTGSDGAGPQASLVLSGNALYGTTVYGGNSSNGTVFALNTDGTGFTDLYSFTATGTNSSGLYTNCDGTYPFAGLVLSGRTLYGSASSGGPSGNGTVFALNTDGTGFTNLHNFAGGDGADSRGGLVLSGNTLYGTTSRGYGSVFALNTDGTGFRTLHSFSVTVSATANSEDFYITDGARPQGGLVLSGSTLYGTGSGLVGIPGILGGAVFAIGTNGGIRVLHNFLQSLYTPQGACHVNGDCSLYFGRDWYCQNGSPHPNFCAMDGSGGTHPRAGLVLRGGLLYGTTDSYYGSDSILFAVSTVGKPAVAGSPPSPPTGFTRLASLGPVRAGLLLSGNVLYGTTLSSLFSYSLPPPPPPQLTIILSGTNAILSWPTNAAGFDYTGYVLQSTTNAVSPSIWSTNSPAPAVIGGQNTVTNRITGAQQFYRLVQ